jgi:hypothetical protein
MVHCILVNTDYCGSNILPVDSTIKIDIDLQEFFLLLSLIIPWFKSYWPYYGFKPNVPQYVITPVSSMVQVCRSSFLCRVSNLLCNSAFVYWTALYVKVFPERVVFSQERQILWAWPSELLGLGLASLCLSLISNLGILDGANKDWVVFWTERGVTTRLLT